MRYQTMLKWGVGVLGLLSSVVTLADVPVVDATAAGAGYSSSQAMHSSAPITETASAPQSISTADLSEAQRLTRLEQQQDNLSNMNLPEQVEHLQQELAVLRGELQVQQHDLKVLSQQQRNFYQDLDGRLAKLQTGGWKNAAESSSKKDNSDLQLQDSAAYQAAFNLLEKKQYKKSFIAFKNYLSDYPHGAYVSNAHYWIGEIYMAQKNTKNAAKEFQLVIRSYPKSSKVPDAKLKLAIIHANMGKQAQAKRELLAIKKQYPKSTAAQLAGVRLEQLTQ